ncbi:MAG: enterotoxin [Acidobacteria bacterium]|nr:enterotoxin [Acidobacteriota bacterium]
MMQFTRSAVVILLSAYATSVIAAQTSEIHAGHLRATVTAHSGRFEGLSVEDKGSGRTISIKEAFVVILKDKTELRSTEMKASPLADASRMIDPHRALRAAGDQIKTERACWQFTPSSTSSPIVAVWCMTARPGTEYIRELLRISAGDNDLPIAEVRLLQFADVGAKVEGSVKGSPIIDGTMFFGLEHPLSISTVEAGVVKASLYRDLPLRAGQSITYSAVIGTSQPGQMRRAFLAYLENERPRPYEPFLHYNSWFDLGYENRFDEAGAIDRINAFGHNLVEQRNVKLDSFLFDDGWDDPNTLWGFNSGFPDGFTKTGEAAAKYHAGIGVWLSPWGGYAEQKDERIAYGKAHGFEIQKDGYALSGPKYYDRFQSICLEMVDKYHVNQFKFDGTGNANNVFATSAFDSDFDAAIHLIERLRKEEPKLFINLTTGTTASPFWLFYADSIWRGGEDHDFSGVGDPRQRWITYRDAQTYKNIVLQGPLFPLNSLMLHGIIYAKQARDLATDPENDFADEVHSYFGSGTQLQEMYITPALLSKTNWDTLAEGARWSRAHSRTLKDTHWVGGDPDKLEVYGWAAWSPDEGILTLRNPSATARHYRRSLAEAFQLDRHSTTVYNLHSVWTDADNSRPRSTQSTPVDKPLDIDLAPFQVLTLQADPLP